MATIRKQGMNTVSARRRIGSLTRDVFRAIACGDRTARDELRFRLERRLGGPIGLEYTRFFVDRYMRPDTFLTEREHRRPTWLGVPTWKIPLDAWTIQEIIVDTRPDLIIETGTQFGGAALFYASMLDLLGSGQVVTVDVDHSAVNEATRAHPRVTLIEGRSTAPEVVDRAHRLATGQRVMIILDSDHGFENVSRELQLLAPLVSPGCYLIVEDTALGRLYLPHWGDPAGALAAWLVGHPEFEVDRSRDRFAASMNPRGYVRRGPS